MARTIPVIDLSAYFNPDRSAADLKALLDAVDAALCDLGFLCIKGHPVPAALIEATQNEAITFFDSPQAHKNGALARRHRSRGYTALGDIALSHAMPAGDRSLPADLFERYRIGPFGLPDDEYHRSRIDTVYPPNVWPSQQPTFQPVMQAWYRAMSTLSRDLMRIFALVLRIPEGWFDGKIDREMSSLCINHYPALAEAPAPGQLRAGPHTDYGTLTIVAPTDAPGGLQVRLRHGEWEDVTVERGAFVVNIGDMMAQWTNDRWVSTLHRVANPPLEGAVPTRRLSLVYFHQPNPDTQVECIPSCVGSGERYEPVPAGRYILDKIAAHFPAPSPSAPPAVDPARLSESPGQPA
jgi:isopenicillin N synthase-like dioxygenase